MAGGVTNKIEIEEKEKGCRDITTRSPGQK